MYIGIDYSSRKVSAARLTYGGRLDWLFSYQVPRDSKNPLDNLNLLLDQYRHSRDMNIPPSDINHVSIEAPIVGNSGAARTAVQMAMVAGALARYEFEQISIVGLVPPSTWKKQVCGKGNLNKQEVSLWLEENRPALFEPCTSDDEVDAVCLALHAMQMSVVPV